MIDHLSYTGQYAGVRYCGSTEGTSCHMPYVKDAVAWATEHIACAACRDLLEEVENAIRSDKS